MIINGLFLPILSLQYPEKALIKDAVLSAIPSIRDIEVFDAPNDSRKSGITLYNIFVDVSVKKLVNPVKKTFLCKPNIFFCSVVFIGCIFQRQNNCHETPNRSITHPNRRLKSYRSRGMAIVPFSESAENNLSIS